MFSDILSAVLIVMSVGVVSAVVLSLASHYMKIDSNERVKEIRSHLPGANCGACGYPGCDGYAEAVFSGKALANLCIPGGKNTNEAISKIIGSEYIASQTLKKAVVRCNCTEAASAKSSIYDGLKSCAAACLVSGGILDCKFACQGFGDCAKVCPTKAISIENMVARVDPQKCIGCEKCVRVCPKNIISVLPEEKIIYMICSNEDEGTLARKKCKNGCIACRKCEKTCPSDAIKIINNLAVVNYEKCIDCGKCYTVCPVGCIGIKML